MSTHPRPHRKEKGIEICGHTCGCVWTSETLKSGRRQLKWLQTVPIYLREGGGITRHCTNSSLHPNCAAGCPNHPDGKMARALSDAEYTAWTPHIGHDPRMLDGIPAEYHHLLPASGAEPDPSTFPTHPLTSTCPLTPSLPSDCEIVHSLLNRLTLSPEAKPSTSHAAPIRRNRTWPRGGPRRLKVLFVEITRASQPFDHDSTAHLVSYFDIVCQPGADAGLRTLLRGAPSGSATLKGVRDDIETWLVHDYARESLPL